MGVKISELQEKTTVSATDVIPIVDEGTKKIAVSTLLQLVFPIGSTYVTQTDVNPSTILGFGIWERVKGKVLIGLDENDTDFNEIEKTGGEKTHALTVAELPTNQISTTKDASGGATDGYIMSGSYNVTGNYNFGGSGQSHNNMPPYQVVGYMWIRKS